jgi:HK97 family phage major capsid protein
VPFSIELDQDWSQVRSELGRLVAEAKDVLEADKFLVGAGSTEPEGLLVGVTGVSTSSATATLTVADIYTVKDAVGPRFQSRGRFVANGSTYSKIRQLDTSGGAALWAFLGDGNPDRLIGYPAHEWSDMDAPTSGGTILAFGDFSKYLIVDRVGMSAEIIPHLFGTTSNFPTGQRGFYALWRNSGTVLVDGAFQVLEAL